MRSKRCKKRNLLFLALIRLAISGERQNAGSSARSEGNIKERGGDKTVERVERLAPGRLGIGRHCRSRRCRIERPRRYGRTKATAILSSLNVLPAQTPPHQFDAESASRQLAQAVHGLAEDRDRLATRLTALQRDIERDMEDVTGSIKKQVEAVKAAKSQPPPWPDDAPPVPMTPADVAAMVKAVSPAPAAPANPPSPNPPAAAASPSPADASPSPAAAYGADIGTAQTMKALHTRWTWLRTAHPTLFDGLQPLVSLKQNPRSNRTELHLVVGPYSNADAAAQFCDFVLPFHLTCQPAMFDGSRLALQ
jgi:hypothetical protein